MTTTETRKKPTALLIISWILMIFLCLLSILPGIGFLSWLIGIPILILTFIFGILGVTRGAQIHGGLIILMSVIVTPVFLVIVPILTTGATFVAGVAAAEEEINKMKQEKISKLSSTPASSLKYRGELAEIFELGSKHTDVQRDNKKNQITGAIIEWEFTVYEVDKIGDYYDITPETELLSNKVTVSTVHIYPQSEEESALIESWTEGAKFTAKGYIDNVTFRSLFILPAILTK